MFGCRRLEVYLLFRQHGIERLQSSNAELREKNEAHLVDLCMRYPAHAEVIVRYVNGEVSERDLETYFGEG
jgi:hypothetical protein